MNEITYIGGGEVLTTSLIIADGVGKPHKSVVQLIRQNIDDFEEFGPLAFEMRKGRPLQHGGFAKATEFALLNEQQASLLMTYMRNNEVVRGFKKRLIKAFYELSKRKEITGDLSRLEILQIAMESEKEKLALKGEVESLKPKSVALDRIASSDGSFCVSDAAKSLQVRPKVLFDWLSAHKWIYRRVGHGGWLAYQDKIQRGQLEHKVATFSRGDGSEKVSEQVRVTSTGLAWLAKNMEVA